MEKRINFKENIDEKTVFESLDGETFSQLSFDFDKVHFINSLGIREFMKFLKTIPSEVQVEFWNCRTSMVRTLNMVTGIMTPNVVIKSFYVPFECETCDKDIEVLQQDGQEYKFRSELPNLDVVYSCETCGSETEPSIVLKTYLKFFSE